MKQFNCIQKLEVLQIPVNMYFKTLMLLSILKHIFFKNLKYSWVIKNEKKKPKQIVSYNVLQFILILKILFSIFSSMITFDIYNVENSIFNCFKSVLFHWVENAYLHQFIV